MSPEPFPDDPYSTSHFEPSIEAGSDKENKKRSPDDASDRSSFGRRPRRKTRPDRYSSKNKATRKSPAKNKNERSRKKSRSKKHRLRSSQDVMTNFASGAIPNTRVTMKPNLTTGLFLNGRSSATAPVADLTFNSTKFLELKPSLREKHKVGQLSTNGETDHDEVETSDNLDHSLQQHTDISKTATTDKDANGKEDIDRCFQDDSSSLNGSNPEPSPDTPRMMLKKLIKTGIFDGTGILKLASDKTTRPKPVKDGESSILEKVKPVRSHASQDNVSMADPGKDLTLPSTAQPPQDTASLYQKHHGNRLNIPANAVCLERQGENIPLYTSRTAQVCSSGVANLDGMKEGHEPSMTQNPSPDLSLAYESATNGRRQSVPKTSEGGRQYVQCIDQDDQRRPMLTSPDSDPADFGYLVHPQYIQSHEPRRMGQPIYGDWQRCDVIEPPQQPLVDEHSLRFTHRHVGTQGLNPMSFPMPATEMQPIQDERGYGNAQTDPPPLNCGNETVQEFFERIEGEVGLE
ncbi:hypothetical protein FPSE_02044 [Fusarium pseudograminearum CS3096]|uniref:Uncharacterized protein n=1 Tax=Fusarium pseudograminearum (strain CS3096) TaxID=1028729 RepID=K3W2K5_FUSPC|nr:hypothetical protein FPSE_02044 [Fusarium pseudograminearum CS3096]EKJ77810.1 hypothetical protein FPSE_02044 [Fusarium pseudograminearum CS3096]KAF0637988.1 hypothetical protein FPSE5266_02044 [Fusarium pseudograminearum]